LLEEVHETLSWTLVTLIAGHVLAALKHHFIDRDDTLRAKQRMAHYISFNIHDDRFYLDNRSNSS